MSVALLRSPLLAGIPGVVHGFTTREGGSSTGALASLNLGQRIGDTPQAVTANRQAVLAALGRPDATWVSARQVHGNAVFEVTRNAGRSMEADGLWTRDHEVMAAVLVADCVPMLVAERSARAIAAVHAGWRGTAARIAEAAVSRLVQAGFAAADLCVTLGPAIGPCCFTIGEDVAAELKSAVPELPRRCRARRRGR